MNKNNVISIFTIFILLNFPSCASPNDKKNNETIIDGNTSTTLSTDREKLSKLIDLKKYPPTTVKFKNVFIDNSGKNERMSVPGPSDSYLQALLNFDSVTFIKIRKQLDQAHNPSSNIIKKNFDFEWLDDNIRSELIKTDTSYHGYPDMLFGSNNSGRLWLLNNKLLLVRSSY